MKRFSEYINEELDDNIWWLLDKWFEYNEIQFKEFIEIVIQCKQTGDKVNVDTLKHIIKGTELEKNLEAFINFIDNEVEAPINKNYLYSLKLIIEVVLGKKENNKYLKGSI